MAFLMINYYMCLQIRSADRGVRPDILVHFGTFEIIPLLIIFYIIIYLSNYLSQILSFWILVRAEWVRQRNEVAIILGTLGALRGIV